MYTYIYEYIVQAYKTILLKTNSKFPTFKTGKLTIYLNTYIESKRKPKYFASE